MLPLDKKFGDHWVTPTRIKSGYIYYSRGDSLKTKFTEQEI